MDSPRVTNATDFIVLPVSLYGPDGEAVVIIVKSTWVLRVPGGAARGKKPAVLVLADGDMARGVRHTDEHWGDPAMTSIRYPADVAITKAGTDVVLIADAWAPDAVPAAHIDVKASIGALQIMLRAHGQRAWGASGAAISSAKPALRVPLRWELAFGGRDEIELGQWIEESRNPVGRGIVGDRQKLDAAPAPQIEAVEAPIRSLEDDIVPIGVGALGRHWEPRRSHMGTYDAAWLDARAPLPPKDEDSRYALFAAPGLHSRTPLLGGEQVMLVNLSREPVLAFALPQIRVAISFEVGGQLVSAVEAPIDTVLIDLLADPGPDPKDEADAQIVVVELVHRAHVLAPRRKRDLVIRVRELLAEQSAGEAPS